MALGLILIGMFGAASVSIGLVVYGFPWWTAILAYPLVGTSILLPGVALVAWIRANRPEPSASQMLTSQSPAGPHPRSTAGSSNP
jgi:uncharacterized membrane protein HdeD (DUF308 family)